MLIYGSNDHIGGYNHGKLHVYKFELVVVLPLFFMSEARQLVARWLHETQVSHWGKTKPHNQVSNSKGYSPQAFLDTANFWDTRVISIIIKQSKNKAKQGGKARTRQNKMIIIIVIIITVTRNKLLLKQRKSTKLPSELNSNLLLILVDKKFSTLYMIHVSTRWMVVNGEWHPGS